uniref:Uncharacterized protein n=1 Tax=Anguilla anguilla TaxID=7936 RepID=A0A0E9WEG9_ANGAN
MQETLCVYAYTHAHNQQMQIQKDLGYAELSGCGLNDTITLSFQRSTGQQVHW